MENKQFLRAAASVVPSARQMQYMDTEFFAFVHFTVNTYTDLEWGKGDEPESIFNPVELDCDQWVEAVKSAGMRGIILTAKHHD
ncbi:MAG: alpha-L-fucosidase, partial [Clostridia bacterium]|nr:alpha-L-fucosidase [Clostridia bacterium]